MTKLDSRASRRNPFTVVRALLGHSVLTIACFYSISWKLSHYRGLKLMPMLDKRIKKRKESNYLPVSFSTRRWKSCFNWAMVLFSVKTQVIPYQTSITPPPPFCRIYLLVPGSFVSSAFAFPVWRGASGGWRRDWGFGIISFWGVWLRWLNDLLFRLGMGIKRKGVMSRSAFGRAGRVESGGSWVDTVCLGMCVLRENKVR